MVMLAMAKLRLNNQEKIAQPDIHGSPA